MQKVANYLLILTIVTGLLLWWFYPKNVINIEPTQGPTPTLVKFDEFKVKRVIDGDTIELDNGETVRYIGIDTPETVHPQKSLQCFGKEASDKNKELVEGKMVKLSKDVSETDRYGRWLRYVYVGDIFVNDYLVRNGYANSYTYPPDVKFAKQFKDAEIEAVNTKKGLWNKCL